MFNRPQTPSTHTLLGDLFGFDPTRLIGAAPQVFGFDIQRTDSGYRVEVPVAGYKPEDIAVSVEDNQLTVQGKNDKRQFTRQLILPDEIDADKIQASVDHGLLTLSLPLHEKVKPRQIQVNVGTGDQKNVTGSSVPTMSGETAQPNGQSAQATPT